MAFFAHDGVFYRELKFPWNAHGLVAAVPEDSDVTFGTFLNVVGD
jgi:hypothetical protein